MHDQKLRHRLAIALLVLLMLLSGCRTIIDDSTEDVGSTPTFVFSSDGLPVFAYFNKKDRVANMTFCGDVKCSDLTTIILDDEGATGQMPSLVLTEDDLPRVSYYSISDKSLRLAICHDERCSDVTRMTLDDTGKVGEFSAIVLASDGSPMISYFDAENKNLKLAVCSDPLCSSVDLVTVDDENDVGESTNIVLMPDDSPYISYFDDESNVLKLAICNDKLCSDPIKRIFVGANPGADTGDFNAMVLGSQGYPMIAYSYYEGSVQPQRGALKMIICTDATCSAPSSVTLDSRKNGRIGQYVDMVLNSKGHPVISFYDAANIVVRVISCKDELCTRTSKRQVGFDWGAQYTQVGVDQKDRVYVAIYEVRPNQKRLLFIPPFLP